jgi:DNA invertase Pin-like site-specific DNA recombinase
MMANVGYIVVNAADQLIYRQMVDAELDEIFMENLPERGAARPRRQAALKALRSGDIFHVHGVDHLAQDLPELRQIVENLIVRGVTVKFYKEWLTFDGSDNPIQNLQRNLLKVFADFQRGSSDLATEDAEEKKQSAATRGRRGRQSTKLGMKDIQEIRARVSRGANKSALAREYGISRPTLYAILTDK